jgi:hypothetical protein
MAMLEHVAARVLEVDQDDVGVDRVDAGEQVRGLVETDHMGVTGLAQSVLQDRRPNRILVDDDDLERRIHPACVKSLWPHDGQFSSPVPDPSGDNSLAMSTRWLELRRMPNC